MKHFVLTTVAGLALCAAVYVNGPTPARAATLVAGASAGAPEPSAPARAGTPAGTATEGAAAAPAATPAGAPAEPSAPLAAETAAAAPAAAPAAGTPTDPAAAAPRTHIDTTVVGSGATGQPAGSAATSLDNNYDFVAGAPDLLRITKRLNLSQKQQARLHDVIENSDAGAAILIEREHDVRQMISATTPEDPLYAKLIADQSAGAAQWTANREKLRRDVLDILTPAQQKRFEELQAGVTPTSHGPE